MTITKRMKSIFNPAHLVSINKKAKMPFSFRMGRVCRVFKSLDAL